MARLHYATKRRVPIVTDDAAYAERAAEAGFPTHLVAPGGDATSQPGLTWHATPAKFKESILRSPILH